MNITLNAHQKGYSVNGWDCLLTVAGGLSGLPFAIRHFQQASKPGESKWHWVVGAFQLIPGIGLLCARIDSIIARFLREQILPDPNTMGSRVTTSIPQTQPNLGHQTDTTDSAGALPATLTQLPISVQTLPSANLVAHVVLNFHMFRGVASYLTQRELIDIATLSKRAQDMIRVLFAKQQCEHLFPLTFFCTSQTQGIKNYSNIMHEKLNRLNALKTAQWKFSEYDVSSLFRGPQSPVPEKGQAFHVSGSYIACYLYTHNRVEVLETTKQTTFSIYLDHVPRHWWQPGELDFGVRIAYPLLVTYHQPLKEFCDQKGEVIFSSLQTHLQVAKLAFHILDITCSDDYIAIWARGDTTYDPNSKKYTHTPELIHIFDTSTGTAVRTFPTYLPDGERTYKLTVVNKCVIATLFTFFAGRIREHSATIFDVTTGEILKQVPLKLPEDYVNGNIEKGSEFEVALLSDTSGFNAPARLVNLIDGTEIAKIDSIHPPFDDMQLVGNQILFTQPDNPSIMALTPVLPNSA